ncbi:uncharacterized protein LOC112157474 [Oryzias melastigma]|uniref:uncharacterized protein LOC112157474 n=1 Tax=Oryzias melastigma TaxID=30732 RepID=UPI000CF7F5FA|nr:uncharacterized protein LOC112157474 [Oryzias melastigma]
MDSLHIILPLLWGAVSCSFDWTSASVSEVTVRHGDNITLYCDCRITHGGPIVWFRNCFHENHPVLVLNATDYKRNWEKTQFRFPKNISSDSYDLTIINVTYSDEGFYYCGTREMKLEDKEHIGVKIWFKYSNIIRKISISYNRRHASTSTSTSQENFTVCWTLLFSVCPALSVLSAFLSVLVYRICKKTAKSSQNADKKQNTRDLMRQTQPQDEDVNYAALEVQHSSLKPQRKRTTQTSDFGIYSAVNTSPL